jgi:hypothetical protein
MPLLKRTKKNNLRRLEQIYEFAEWCYRQKEKDLWNAAAVAFYEHLGDKKETSESISNWVKPDIYKEIRELLKIHIGEMQLHDIDRRYGTNFN